VASFESGGFSSVAAQEERVAMATENDIELMERSKQLRQQQMDIAREHGEKVAQIETQVRRPCGRPNQTVYPFVPLNTTEKEAGGGAEEATEGCSAF
jgi:hypothetical protein